MAKVHRPGSTLKWLGDSLLCNRDPAFFRLMRSDGGIEDMSLRECLAVAHRIDPYGRRRIVLALEYGLQHNLLADEDRDAWVTQRAHVLSWETE